MTSLSDLALDKALIPSKHRVPVIPDESYPNLGIRNFGRGVFEKPPILGLETSATTLFRAQAGQLIYSRLFAFEGAYAVVPKALDGYFVSSEFPLFDIDADQVDPDYLGWLFRWPPFWRELAKLANGVGDRRKRVEPKKLLAKSIQVPARGVQEALAYQLTTLSTGLTARKRARQSVDRELEALLQRTFSDIVTGAPSRPMSKIAPLVRRPITVEPDDFYPELGIRSFGKGTFDKPPISGWDVGGKKLFDILPGDLVFNIVFAWEGAVALVPPFTGRRVGSHRYLTCVVDESQILPDFLQFFFTTKPGLDLLLRASPGGAGRNRTLGVDKFAMIEVPVPEPGAQKRFVAVLEKIRRARTLALQADADAEAALSCSMNRAFRHHLLAPLGSARIDARAERAL